MTDKQCSSCGGFCKKSGCERENTQQIGITYEEANLPQPHCERCGKKLGTEVTDIHTCTPKTINMETFVGSGKPLVPVCWMNENDIDKTDWKVWAHGKPTASMPLFASPQNKKWVGLTEQEKKDIFKVCAITDRGYVAAMVEAKLKEKNCD